MARHCGDLLYLREQTLENLCFCAGSEVDLRLLEHTVADPYTFVKRYRASCLMTVYPDGYDQPGVQRVLLSRKSARSSDALRHLHEASIEEVATHAASRGVTSADWTAGRRLESDDTINGWCECACCCVRFNQTTGDDDDCNDDDYNDDDDKNDAFLDNEGGCSDHASAVPPAQASSSAHASASTIATEQADADGHYDANKAAGGRPTQGWQEWTPPAVRATPGTTTTTAAAASNDAILTALAKVQEAITALTVTVADKAASSGQDVPPHSKASAHVPFDWENAGGTTDGGAGDDGAAGDVSGDASSMTHRGGWNAARAAPVPRGRAPVRRRT